MVNVQDTIGTLVYFWINYSFLGFFIGITVYFALFLDYSKALVVIVNEHIDEQNDKYKRIKDSLVELIELRIFQKE